MSIWCIIKKKKKILYYYFEKIKLNYLTLVTIAYYTIIYKFTKIPKKNIKYMS